MTDGAVAGSTLTYHYADVAGHMCAGAYLSRYVTSTCTAVVVWRVPSCGNNIVGHVLR